MKFDKEPKDKQATWVISGHNSITLWDYLRIQTSIADKVAYRNNLSYNKQKHVDL